MQYSTVRMRARQPLISPSPRQLSHHSGAGIIRPKHQLHFRIGIPRKWRILKNYETNSRPPLKDRHECFEYNRTQKHLSKTRLPPPLSTSRNVAMTVGRDIARIAQIRIGVFFIHCNAWLQRNFMLEAYEFSAPNLSIEQPRPCSIPRCRAQTGRLGSLIDYAVLDLRLVTRDGLSRLVTLGYLKLRDVCGRRAVLSVSCATLLFTIGAVGRSGEMADAQDLKSWGLKRPCGFESRLRHHIYLE